MKVSKRKHSFLKSDLPLTSKRGRFVLSSPKESKNLLRTVRANRDLKTGAKPQTITFSSPDFAEKVKEMR